MKGSFLFWNFCHVEYHTSRNIEMFGPNGCPHTEITTEAQVTSKGEWSAAQIKCDNSQSQNRLCQACSLSSNLTKRGSLLEPAQCLKLTSPHHLSTTYDVGDVGLCQDFNGCERETKCPSCTEPMGKKIGERACGSRKRSTCKWPYN